MAPPPALTHLRAYVVVDEGETDWLPLIGFVPDQPSVAVQVIGKVAAFVMRHDSVVDEPRLIEVELAEKLRAGATGAGVGLGDGDGVGLGPGGLGVGVGLGVGDEPGLGRGEGDGDGEAPRLGVPDGVGRTDGATPGDGLAPGDTEFSVGISPFCVSVP